MIFVPSVLYVIGCSIFTTVLTTLIEWYFVYSKEEYKELKEDITHQEKQLEKEKRKKAENKRKLLNISEEKKQKKKKKESEDRVKQLEKTLSELKTKMSLMSFKGMLLGGVVMFSTFSYLNKTFDGIVVARLPFEPFGFLTTITHRSLPGTDYTECAFLFIYILATMAIRTNVQKYFGWQPAGAGNPFALPEMPQEETSASE
jgi:uncharacterized membrane protein (DUF106 family)